jgi:hypothetical protein
MLLSALPGSALAQEEDAAATATAGNQLSLRVTAGAGATDNANLGPSDPVPPERGRTSDTFAIFSPEARYALLARRGLYAATYRFDAQMSFEDDEASSYTHQGSLGALWLLSPRSRAGLLLAAGQGRTDSFTGASPELSSDASTTGRLRYRNLSATASLQWEAGPRWTVEQTLTAGLFTPLGESRDGNPDTQELRLALDGRRSAERTALTLRYQLQYFHVAGLATPAGGAGAEMEERPALDQFLTGPGLSWQRDLSATLSAELGGGVQFLIAADDPALEQIGVQPAAQAALRYDLERSAVQLRYGHDTRANPLLGQIFSTDSVTLSGRYTLRRAPIFVTGTLGFQHGRELTLPGSNDEDPAAGDGVTQEPRDRANNYLADATLGWQVNRHLELAVRYQFRMQQAPPEATLRDFTANTGVVQLSVSYPAEDAAPRDPLQRSRRVDGSDRTDPFADPETGPRSQPKR